MRGDAVEKLLGEVSPRSLLAAMAAIAGLTLLAGHLYVVKPSLARLRALDSGGSQTTVANLQAEAAQMDGAIQVTQQQLDALRDRLFGGPSDLAPEKVESYIVERLDRISARHAVELVSVKPGDAREVLMFDELLYEVEVKGQFFALVAWLWELEEELRPLVVNGFDMQPTPQGGWVGMKLRLASYRPSGEVS